MYRYLYYKLQRQITQQTYIYKDIYINTTNVNFPAHKKFPNVTLWFFATQQISETTKHVNFPAQITKTTRTITRKPQQILANRKFSIHSSIQMLYPAKTAKKSHSAKSKITYLTKKKKSHSAIQMLFQYKGFFNFSQKDIATTPFFTTK